MISDIRGDTVTMAVGDEVRVELGFTGGGSVQISTDKSQFEQLQAALTGDKDRWVTVQGKDDAEYLIGASSVVYVRSMALSRSIGFGS